jgi:GT2 family glycosyltransferase
VVVVNWNGGELFLDCLQSIVEDAGGPGSAVEVVVVDNASSDGSVERAEQLFEGLRVVRRSTNEGFAAGANAGIAAARGDVVVLVNNDARVEPGFLAAITAPLNRPEGEDVAAVTGRVLLAGRYRPAGPDAEGGLVGHDGRRWLRVASDEFGEELVNSTGNQMTRSGNGRDRDWLAPADAPAAPAEVFGFNGGCVALRRQALDEVGVFDTALFMYYEDTDLSWRLRRAGWRIEHASEARTRHQHAASSGTSTEFFQVHNLRNRLVVSAAQAPWPVVLRALVRTLWHLLSGPRRGRTARALAQAARMAPSALATRRRIDSTATVPRHEVARWLVPD